MSDIKPGDLVTLKGLGNQKEKPLGIVKRNVGGRTFEIFWINEGIATRFALVDMAKSHRLEIVSSAEQKN
jgi:hypothetical protein|tara:strand:- start:22 stop:231 length:210 start_codon:yes stop_codon:yes gene_type:complete